VFEEELDLTKFRVTIKTVIKNLECLENIPLDELKDEVINAFDGYHYEGEESIKFSEGWDITQDGEYVLNVGIDHKYAYEFSVYIIVMYAKATIKNVL
jgi:hypothetical protein